jgi:NDP-sugar pyrophosphorylase family protein
MIKNILIFCGGYGKRLGNLTKKTPKPLLVFHKKPFIDYVLKRIITIKPKKIIFLCKYKNTLFIKKFHKKKIGNIRLYCVVEKKTMGTGGSLYNAKKFILNNTLLLNGDTFFNIDFKKLKKINIKKKAMFIMLVKNYFYKSNKKLSKLFINKKKIIGYKEKSNLMNSGFYIINKKIIQFLLKKKISLEEHIIPGLIEKKLVIGKIYNEDHIDIGTKKNFEYFNKYSKNLN